ncbi:MAG: hypothetical protein WCA89_02085 [Terracidiphilus sp.]
MVERSSLGVQSVISLPFGDGQATAVTVTDTSGKLVRLSDAVPVLGR